MASDNAAPRILKITYKSGKNRRLARVFAKVPYSGIYDLNEKLARMFAKGEITWYRVDKATPDEINENRSTLGRWLGALSESSTVTRVDWLA